jgi:SAM-dependent methyltransferase
VGLKRAADQCPICHSTARERLIWFWLSQMGQGFRFGANCRTAHFAPEKGLTIRLREAAPANYVAYDFEPSRYRHLSGVKQADLGGLAIADSSVDLLVCNHVLEHVPDVARALSEILRVLAPGGTAILQVPIALKLEQSIELGLDSKPEDRIALLGQDDHLRLFTHDDYVAALSCAGFAVEPFDAFAADGQAATDWRLDPFETLFVCRKPG